MRGLLPVCGCVSGVMLIDRNDELAALHEKGHLQEAQIAAGTMQLSLREDEVCACLCCFCCAARTCSVDPHAQTA